MSQVRPVSVARLRALDRFVILVFVSLARLMVRSSPTVLRTRLARLCSGVRLGSYFEVQKVRDAVLSSSSLCRGSDACLIRSVTVLLVCRWKGYVPVWCVGVAVVPPFAAHAWLEAEGRVVDEPFTVDSFKAFFKVPESSRVDA